MDQGLRITSSGSGPRSTRTPRRLIDAGGAARGRALIGALAASLAALVAVSAVAQEQSSPALEIARHAEQLVREGKFQEALVEAEKAIEADENFYGAYWVQGLAYGNLGRPAEAYDAFVRATELQPGWAEAHRMAAIAALQSGQMEAAWEHAIKAQQGGADMSQSFAMLRAQSAPPDDLEEQLSVARVFVGGIDSTTFEAGGTNASARTTLSVAASDIFQMQQEMRRKLAASRRFGLVQRREMADYVMIFEIESLSAGSAVGGATRLRGALELVDARSGEEAYRRRIDLTDISSRSYLNREFDRVVSLLEEWAAKQKR